MRIKLIEWKNNPKDMLKFSFDFELIETNISHTYIKHFPYMRNDSIQTK